MLYEDYINLHQIPELGFKERKTSAYIQDRLKLTKAKLTLINTGVCAFFDFKKEETIAFRAEEDALPIKEQTGLNYVYKGNYMHACGHDGHMAMLLNLADIINDYLDYPYNILLVFQPSEESLGGSLSMIPYLNKYKFKAFISLHVFPFLKKGEIYSSFIPVFANSVEVDLLIKGKSSHVFDYKKQNDAMLKGIKLINKIKKEAKKLGLLFHVGEFKSGTKRNICPSKTIIKASLRGKDDKITNEFKNYLMSLNTQNCIIKLSELIPCVLNTYLEKDLYNKLKVNILDKTLFLADDFAFYPSHYNKLFFLLGTDNKYFLHNDKFSLNNDDLVNGLNFFLRILEYFKKVN